MYYTLRFKFWLAESPITIWRELIGESSYNLALSEASRLHSLALRYVHKFLVHSISGKKESTGVVSQRDLFYLYYLSRGTRCHLGHAFASYLRGACTCSTRGDLYRIHDYATSV